MKLGYARISKADGSQTLDLQLDALTAAGIATGQVYKDEAYPGGATTVQAWKPASRRFALAMSSTCGNWTGSAAT